MDCVLGGINRPQMTLTGHLHPDRHLHLLQGPAVVKENQVSLFCHLFVCFWSSLHLRQFFVTSQVNGQSDKKQNKKKMSDQRSFVMMNSTKRV